MLIVTLVPLIGCKSIPKWPSDINKLWVIDIPGIARDQKLDKYILNNDTVLDFQTRSNQLSCLEFNIVQQNPLLLDFVGVTDLTKCQGLTGLPPGLFQKLMNWIDDVYRKFSTQENENDG